VKHTDIIILCIVVSLIINNTPYDKIDKPRKEHKPNTSRLNSIRKSWESQLDEEDLYCRA